MTGFSQPPDPDGDPVDAEAPAAQPMTPDDRQAPPVVTEGVGEDPGDLPEDGSAIEPVGPDAPEPDVNDGEAPHPLSDSTGDAENVQQGAAGLPEHDSATPAFDEDQDDPDALPRGQHGQALDLGDG